MGPGLEILATHDGEPVGVREGDLVALAFHPELTEDGRLFTWFLEQVVMPARALADVNARAGHSTPVGR